MKFNYLLNKNKRRLFCSHRGGGSWLVHDRVWPFTFISSSRPGCSFIVMFPLTCTCSMVKGTNVLLPNLVGLNTSLSIFDLVHRCTIYGLCSHNIGGFH